MKKSVPNLININFETDCTFSERLLVNRINHNIEKGYATSEYDLDRYFAALIRNVGINKMPESFKEYCLKYKKLKDRIRYNLIRFTKESNGKVSKSNSLFYKKYLSQKINYRNEYIIKEINRTGINGKKTLANDSTYYEQLKKITSKIEDEVTLLDGYISVKIRFEELVHIFIKHVEETMFSEGQFKKRTFFSYNFEDIWPLLNTIIKQEASSIFEHFTEVKVGLLTKDQNLIKDYHRGFKNFTAIEYNNDFFALSIRSNGYIQKLHQL